MKICALCKGEIDVDKYFSRKSVCPKCGEALRICLNCTWYSVTSHNKCLEPKAEYQRTRDKANFCDYFLFKEAMQKSSGADKEDVRQKFDELFKK